MPEIPDIELSLCKGIHSTALDGDKENFVLYIVIGDKSYHGAHWFISSDKCYKYKVKVRIPAKKWYCLEDHTNKPSDMITIKSIR